MFCDTGNRGRSASNAGRMERERQGDAEGEREGDKRWEIEDEKGECN
jgi:hypothetical protein